MICEVYKTRPLACVSIYKLKDIVFFDNYDTLFVWSS